MKDNRLPPISDLEAVDDLEVSGAISHVEAARMRKTMKPDTILQEAQRLVHGQRNEDYGHPADDFAKTAKIWSGILMPKLKTEITAEDVALCMIGVKLSREVNWHKRDNLVDIAGYAATAAMLHDDKKAKS